MYLFFAERKLLFCRAGFNNRINVVWFVYYFEGLVVRLIIRKMRHLLKRYFIQLRWKATLYHAGEKANKRQCGENTSPA